MALAESNRVLLLSGLIGAGKTTVALMIAKKQIDANLLNVRRTLFDLLDNEGADRATLQAEGARLDSRTNGRWLLMSIAERLEADEQALVVDSCRTRRQTEPILEEVPESRLVFLEASPATRRQRFASSRRSDPLKQSMSFDRSMTHRTERDVLDLRAMSDLVVPTDGLSASEVVQLIADELGWDD